MKRDDLGLSSAIPRRDFLQGVAVAIGSLATSCGRGAASDRALRMGPIAAPLGPAPAGFERYQGQDHAQMGLGHRVRDRKVDAADDAALETGERYDLVVIGAGIAGLAAALTFTRERNGRVLIVDTAGGVGGHAVRNTFEHEGERFVAHGGATGLEDPEDAPSDARALLKGVGVTEELLRSLRDDGHRARHGLRSGLYLPPRVHPSATAGLVTGVHVRPWSKLLADASLDDDARRELITFFTTARDPYEELSAAARRDAQSKLSWADFIRRHLGLGDLAVKVADLFAADLVGLGADAVSVAGARAAGIPIASDGPWPIGRDEDEDDARFPDGNHTIARCLLAAMRPDALDGYDAGGQTPDAAFHATLRDDALDDPRADVRVRLRTMATAVRHVDGERAVEVELRGLDGGARRVRAGAVVIAGYGRVARRIVTDLPSAQREALLSQRKTSLLYVNVLLRRWEPMKAAGVWRVYTPAGFASSMQLADAFRMGGYRPRAEPDTPTVLSIYKQLYRPGAPLDEQLAAGRLALETTPFETWERQLREELQLIFGPHGFEAARDVLAITINRWGHGYAFAAEPREDGATAAGEHRRAREPLGRIAFAGSDAAGEPWLQAAVHHGIRAAREVITRMK
jgi:spermidine dehydrogenase